jgi:hypothetical protein
MKLKMIAALSIATAATLPLAAIANACGGGGDIPPNTEFITPSGNIVCSYYSDYSGVGCEIRDHTWVVPTSTHGPEGRACDFNFGGLNIYVSQAREGRLGCYEGASTFNRPGVSTLDYGQTISRGAITCDSDVSGVTCTDTATGHFFHVSREDYQLG